MRAAIITASIRPLIPANHRCTQHAKTDTCWHEVQDEQDEGDVGAAGLGLADFLAPRRLGAAHLVPGEVGGCEGGPVEDPRRHAGDDQQEEGQELQAP